MYGAKNFRKEMKPCFINREPLKQEYGKTWMLRMSSQLSLIVPDTRPTTRFMTKPNSSSRRNKLHQTRRKLVRSSYMCEAKKMVKFARTFQAKTWLPNSVTEQSQGICLQIQTEESCKTYESRNQMQTSVAVPLKKEENLWLLVTCSPL